MLFSIRRYILTGIAGVCFTSGLGYAQHTRTFGAGAFQIDDGFGKTLTWDLTSPVSSSYKLHFPNTPPSDPTNFLMTDANGNMAWASSTFPPLAPGNIWFGNALSVATPLPPTVVGAVLFLNNSLQPAWTTTLPSTMTVSASQITSGTLPPGTVIDAGPGSIIEPAGGTVNANLLSGSGFGKYSGKIVIPTGANHLDISYAGIMAFSSVTVAVFDPLAMTFGFVDAKVSQIDPGVGFTVIFSADYPNSGTGQLHYTVVNP